MERDKDAGPELSKYSFKIPDKFQFKCPNCNRVSFNQNDAKYEYCGACKIFASDILKETK